MPGNFTDTYSYIPSISVGEKVSLEINFGPIKEESRSIQVRVSYKDGYGKYHADELEIDFAKLREEKREMLFREDSLENIANKLGRIENKLEGMR